MNRLEQELRSARPCGTPPADLHRSILRAVRAAANEPAPASDSLLWRWMVAPALAVLAAALWLSWPQPAEEAPPWSAPPPALAQAHAAPQQASAVVLAPLADELEFLNRDMRRTVDFLIASLP